MEVNTRAPVVASSEIVVGASPEVVWAVLSDVDGWPDWNPGVKTASMDGLLTVGTSFRWRAGSMMINTVMREIDTPRTIGWSGQTLRLPAIHVYRIEPCADGSLVRTTESWDGLLAVLFKKALTRYLQRSLDAGLEYLKVESESRTAGQKS